MLLEVWFQQQQQVASTGDSFEAVRYVLSSGVLLIFTKRGNRKPELRRARQAITAAECRMYTTRAAEKRRKVLGTKYHYNSLLYREKHIYSVWYVVGGCSITSTICTYL